jgi:ATP-dependent helicase/nuclease subunit B
MKLRTIPANLPFLDTLAARWLAAHADPSRGMLLLPTRRAARALAEAFLRATGGRPLLLPRITALGALDEAPLALAGALALPPPVGKLDRLAHLARLVLARPAEHGGTDSADRAWMLAQELAALMDEAERAELDLPSALAGAVDAAYAEHWQKTLQFLDIVTRAWPEWLAASGLANPAARSVALLRAQARAWAAAAPPEPVWIAGTTAAIPAVAALLRAVARLPDGLVVLPGLDTDLPEAAWEALDDSHPQAALRHLLAGLGATRADVQPWDVQPSDGPPAAPAGRVGTLHRALLPAASLSAWRTPSPTDLTGLTRLSPADAQEEAVAIAMLLRDALEVPGRRAALVTPDRALAGRVAAELLRWGVVADDSAGEKLADSPPAVFLRLLARAVEARLAPVALLSLLKHPLAGAGLSTAACRAAARDLERAALRGPRPPPGLTGLRERLDGAANVPEPARGLLDRLEAALAPSLRVAASLTAPPADALAALIESAEALAATDTEGGPERLWAHEEGEALAALLSEALAALALLPDQPPGALPGLLDALLEGEVVRSRRALRGRDAVAEHPRIFIWGLLEARLQSVDMVVLGGLAEGVWPPATDPGPWLSRPMRKAAGLPSPEERIGLAAHDFVAAACAAPVAVLSCPRRRDNAPAVPSRWLVRLDAFLTGQGLALPANPAVAWARGLDLPTRVTPAAPPRPRPPLHLRPRKLNVTEIETLLADPFAIYARHVLRLRPLDPLEQETDALDYGKLVHHGMELFYRDVGAAWPARADEKLRQSMEIALGLAKVRPALAEWWLPRLHRIANWIAEQEPKRRADALAHVVPEHRGVWRLPELNFELHGRADRIEQHASGRIAILDYKTGALPSQKDVDTGFAPQLLLEAAMARAGAFGADLAGEVAELTYLHLTGGFVPGESLTLFKRNPALIAEAVANAEAKLRELITYFDNPATPYLSVPHPSRAPRFSDYAQLARRAEWAEAGEEG